MASTVYETGNCDSGFEPGPRPAPLLVCRLNIDVNQQVGFYINIASWLKLVGVS